MIDEYITKEKAISFFLANGEYDHQNANKHFINGLETYKKWLSTLPPEDVKPVVRGKWIDDKVSFYRGCPKCGCFLIDAVGIFLDNVDHYNYCPNCGADLREKNSIKYNNKG